MKMNPTAVETSVTKKIYREGDSWNDPTANTSVSHGNYDRIRKGDIVGWNKKK